MEPKATGEIPSALRQAVPLRFRQAAGLPGCGRHPEPANLGGRVPGGTSSQRKERKKMPSYHGLWNWGNSTTRAPSKALPEAYKQGRLPREELPGRSSIILTLILSLNHTYIVTSLLGTSFLPHWIRSCWRVRRALQFSWNKPADPAQSNTVRSCLITNCIHEPTLSILEQCVIRSFPAYFLIPF